MSYSSHRLFHSWLFTWTLDTYLPNLCVFWSHLKPRPLTCCLLPGEQSGSFVSSPPSGNLTPTSLLKSPSHPGSLWHSCEHRIHPSSTLDWNCQRRGSHLLGFLGGAHHISQELGMAPGPFNSANPMVTCQTQPAPFTLDRLTTMLNSGGCTQMNSSTRQKQTHWHREQTCDRQGGGGWGGMEWEVGISRCKLICMEWINNKVLLYNTGNCIQYPMINHNGRDYKKSMYIYVV